MQKHNFGRSSANRAFNCDAGTRLASLQQMKLTSSTCPPSARSRSPVTSGRTTPRLTVGAQAKVHLDLGGGAAARKAPVRIAGCWIRIVGEIQPPVLLRDAGQRQADGPLTRLLIERGSR